MPVKPCSLLDKVWVQVQDSLHKYFPAHHLHLEDIMLMSYVSATCASCCSQCVHVSKPEGGPSLLPWKQAWKDCGCAAAAAAATAAGAPCFPFLCIMGCQGWSLVFEFSNIWGLQDLEMRQPVAPSSSTQILLSRRRNFWDVDLRREKKRQSAGLSDAVLNKENAVVEDLLGPPLFQISVAHSNICLSLVTCVQA